MFKFARILIALSALSLTAQIADAHKPQPKHRFGAEIKDDFMNNKGVPDAEGWKAEYVYKANPNYQDPSINARVTSAENRNNTGGYLLEANNPGRGETEMFMYLHKAINRLQPNVDYQIELHNLTISSNQIDYSKSECVALNIGLGKDSYVKLGATTYKPEVVAERFGDEMSSHLRFFDYFPDGTNFSYGEYSFDQGSHTRKLGNIGYKAMGGDCSPQFVTKVFPQPKGPITILGFEGTVPPPKNKPLIVQTDDNGTLHIMVAVHTASMLIAPKLSVYIKNIELSIFPAGGVTGGVPNMQPF